MLIRKPTPSLDSVLMWSWMPGSHVKQLLSTRRKITPVVALPAVGKLARSHGRLNDGRLRAGRKEWGSGEGPGGRSQLTVKH